MEPDNYIIRDVTYSSLHVALLRTPRCKLNTGTNLGLAITSTSFAQQDFVSLEFKTRTIKWQSCNAWKCANVTSAT